MKNCDRCKKVLGECDPQVILKRQKPEEKTLCYDCYIKWTLAGRPPLTMWLVVLILCFLPVSAIALEMGKEQAILAPICISLEAAKELAEVDAKAGNGAVVAVLRNSKACMAAEFIAVPIKVRHEVKTARGKTSVVEVHVEMQDDSWRSFYILIDVPIKGERDV